MEASTPADYRALIPSDDELATFFYKDDEWSVAKEDLEKPKERYKIFVRFLSLFFFSLVLTSFCQMTTLVVANATMSDDEFKKRELIMKIGIPGHSAIRSRRSFLVLSSPSTPRSPSSQNLQEPKRRRRVRRSERCHIFSAWCGSSFRLSTA